MDLATLPARPLEVAPNRGPETPVVVARHQLDPVQPALLERAEQRLIARLARGVGDLHREHLPHPVVSHAGDDEHPLAHHAAIDADVLVPGVHAQVGVGVLVERPAPPRCEFPVQPAGERRDLALGESSPAQLLGDCRHLAGRAPLQGPSRGASRRGPVLSAGSGRRARSRRFHPDPAAPPGGASQCG